MESSLITGEYFKKRIIDLFLRSGLKDFPTKRRDQLIILKSIVLGWDDKGGFSEVEVNDRIKQWLAEIGLFPGWDHVMLRRRLVDERLITRTPDGSSYQLDLEGPVAVVFDPEIFAMDLLKIIAEGKREIVRKREAYLQDAVVLGLTKGV
jgi:hypothetical protein